MVDQAAGDRIEREARTAGGVCVAMQRKSFCPPCYLAGRPFAKSVAGDLEPTFISERTEQRPYNKRNLNVDSARHHATST